MNELILQTVLILADGDSSSGNSISSILTAAAAFVTAMCGGAATLVAALRAGNRRAAQSARDAENDDTAPLDRKKMAKAMRAMLNEMENEGQDFDDEDADDEPRTQTP